MFRNEPHGPQIEKLSAMFSKAVKVAEEKGIKMADKNHIDYDPDEMVQLIENVNSPNFGINFDTGNFMRVHADPIEGMKKLAKYTFATHVKDLKPMKGVPVTHWHFFASTPVGDGFVDNFELARLLNEADYQGFLAMEIDFLHPDYKENEDKAVAQSVKYLKKIAASVG